MPDNQLTLDQELDALFKPAAEPSPTPQSAEPAAAAQASATEPPAETPPVEPPAEETPTPPPAAETLEAKLDKIEETPTAQQAAPALTPEQQQILASVPTPQLAQSLVETAQRYQALDNAIANREFDAVEQMFAPDALDALKEHFYQKYVLGGELIDRWIADKEGNPTVHRGIQSLQQEVQQLKTQLADQQRGRQTQAQQEAMARVTQNYVSHLDSLFEQIEFSKADRPWVMNAINAQVSANTPVRQAIANGNVAAVNAIFKQAVKDFISRDQAAVADKQAAINKQQARNEQHKPLTQSAAIEPTPPMPDDVRQVPKGQEDAWMDHQLAKLFGRK